MSSTLPSGDEWFEAIAAALEPLIWLDYVGFTFQGLVLAFGLSLNGFIIWILGQELRRSNADVLQLNMAAVDLMESLGAPASAIATRFILPVFAKEGRLLHVVTVLFLLVGIHFDGMNAMLTAITRTKQVNSSIDSVIGGSLLKLNL